MLDLVRINSLDDFLAHHAATATVRSAREDEEFSLVQESDLFTVPAQCYVCARPRHLAVRFTSEERTANRLPNWREHLLCPGCRLNARLRACFQIFDSMGAPGTIYLPEQRSPFFRLLRERYGTVAGSEFLGPTYCPGQKNWRGLRHEDLALLSFDDASFEAILCFEVYEHIADYPAALRECFRCLKSPGLLMFTVPFLLSSQHNLTRARQRPDRTVEHLFPPEYHTDPFGRRDVLCFHHFGWQLLQELTAIGFHDCHGLLFWSRHFGYLGQESVVFFARK